MIGKYVYYNGDSKPILYQVRNIEEKTATISGVYHRVIKKVDVNDIVVASESDCKLLELEEKNRLASYQKLNIRSKKHLCGKVLHIDGDSDYLNRCVELYNNVGVYAYGVLSKEEDISKIIQKHIEALTPDVVVITGHDSYNGTDIKNLSNYTHTSHFCDAIKMIRKIKGKNDIIVIAGACQSNFEALIASGANFASSPKRINIHTYDPAILAIKAATTDYKKSISLNNIERMIENGLDAFGGVDSFGTMRLIL